jgi:hypothetical protein
MLGLQRGLWEKMSERGEMVLILLGLHGAICEFVEVRILKGLWERECGWFVIRVP